jgi:hypothetical protein
MRAVEPRRQTAGTRSVAPPFEHLLSLQQSAGNRAVATMVQRSCCSSCASGGSCEGESERDHEGATTAPVVQRLTTDRPTLREGSSGPDVAALQTGLNQLLGTDLADDGAFGPKTADVVRQFQSSRGLGEDGIVGPATWQAFDGDGATPSVPGKATDPADDFRIKGLPTDHLSHADSIFFDFASSTIPDDELAKLDSLSAIDHDVVLEGTSSEEGQGNSALTDARVSAVAKALTEHGHTLAKVRKNSTAKAVGQIDYRSARVVRVTRTDAPDPLADCSAKGSVVDCPPSVDAAFDRAADLLMLAVIKMGSPDLLSDADHKLIRDLFVDDSPGAIAEVAGHMVNLRQYVLDTKANRQRKDEPEPGSGPFHRCESSCNSTCSAGALAFNRGVDTDSSTTFCEGFGNMASPAPGTGTTVEQSQTHILIHESAHGTKVIDCQDFAKGTERAFGLLNREQALHNADSFTALARNLVDPNSAATKPLKPDTGERGTDPGVEEPLAWLDRWFEAADFDTSQLYGVLKTQTGVPWDGDGSHFERTMQLTSAHFPVTAPPRAPTKRDREIVAAINDRYDRVRKVLKTNDAGLTIDTGPTVLWEPGPGRKLAVPADFGDLPIRRRIELLAEALLVAFPDVRSGQEQAYAQLAPKLCNNRTPGFAFSG